MVDFPSCFKTWLQFFQILFCTALTFAQSFGQYYAGTGLGGYGGLGSLGGLGTLGGLGGYNGLSVGVGGLG